MILVPRHLYFVSSYRALKFTRWETCEKKMHNLQLVWELLTSFPTSGCKDRQLQNNSRSTPEALFITAHLHRLSSCWCSSVVTFAELFKEKDRRLRLSCPALLQNPPKAQGIRSWGSSRTHSLFECPGINLRGKADRGTRKGSSLCLGAFALHRNDLNS